MNLQEEVDKLMGDALSDKNIKKLSETHAKIMEDGYKVVKTDADEPAPILLVHGMKNGEKETSLVGFANLPEDKLDAFRTVGSVVREREKDFGLPYCITFSSEAWMAKFDKGEEGKMEKLVEKYDGKISKFPKKYRKEITMVSTLTVEGKMSMSVYDIKRDKKGDRTGIKLSLYKPNLDAKAESPMMGQFFVGWATGNKGSKFDARVEEL